MRALIIFCGCLALSEGSLFNWFGQKGDVGSVNPPDGGALEVPPEQFYFQVPENVYYGAQQPFTFFNFVAPRPAVVQHPIPVASGGVETPISASFGSSAPAYAAPVPAVQFVGAQQVPVYAQFGTGGPSIQQSSIQATSPLQYLVQSPVRPVTGSALHVSNSGVGGQAVPVVFADHLSTSSQSVSHLNVGGSSGSFNMHQSLPGYYQVPQHYQTPVSSPVAGAVHVSNAASFNPVQHGQVAVADHRYPSSQSAQPVRFPGISIVTASGQVENMETDSLSTTVKPFDFPSSLQTPYTSPADFNGASLDSSVPLPAFNVENSFGNLQSSYGPPIAPVVQNEKVSKHAYTLGDGTQVSEQTSVVTGADGVSQEVVKSGEYEYIAENGSVKKVKWIADDNGFRVLP